MNAPKNIRKIRAKAGMSQQQFALTIGVTQSAVSLYESGGRLPTLRTVYKILDLCELEGLGKYKISDLIPREDVLLSEHEVLCA